MSLNETRDPDGTGRIVKFGPDRVEAPARMHSLKTYTAPPREQRKTERAHALHFMQEFLEKNKPLSMIIRAHECVMAPRACLYAALN